MSKAPVIDPATKQYNEANYYQRLQEERNLRKDLQMEVLKERREKKELQASLDAAREHSVSLQGELDKFQSEFAAKVEEQSVKSRNELAETIAALKVQHRQHIDEYESRARRLKEATEKEERRKMEESIHEKLNAKFQEQLALEKENFSRAIAERDRGVEKLLGQYQELVDYREKANSTIARLHEHRRKLVERLSAQITNGAYLRSYKTILKYLLVSVWVRLRRHHLFALKLHKHFYTYIHELQEYYEKLEATDHAIQRQRIGYLSQNEMPMWLKRGKVWVRILQRQQLLNPASQFVNVALATNAGILPLQDPQNLPLQLDKRELEEGDDDNSHHHSRHHGATSSAAGMLDDEDHNSQEEKSNDRNNKSKNGDDDDDEKSNASSTGSSPKLTAAEIQHRKKIEKLELSAADAFVENARENMDKKLIEYDPSNPDSSPSTNLSLLPSVTSPAAMGRRTSTNTFSVSAGKNGYKFSSGTANAAANGSGPGSALASPSNASLNSDPSKSRGHGHHHSHGSKPITRRGGSLFAPTEEPVTRTPRAPIVSAYAAPPLLLPGDAPPRPPRKWLPRLHEEELFAHTLDVPQLLWQQSKAAREREEYYKATLGGFFERGNEVSQQVNTLEGEKYTLTNTLRALQMKLEDSEHERETLRSLLGEGAGGGSGNKNMLLLSPKHAALAHSSSSVSTKANDLTTASLRSELAAVNHRYNVLSTRFEELYANTLLAQSHRLPADGRNLNQGYNWRWGAEETTSLDAGAFVRMSARERREWIYSNADKSARGGTKELHSPSTQEGGDASIAAGEGAVGGEEEKVTFPAIASSPSSRSVRARRVLAAGNPLSQSTKSLHQNGGAADKRQQKRHTAGSPYKLNAHSPQSALLHPVDTLHYTPRRDGPHKGNGSGSGSGAVTSRSNNPRRQSTNTHSTASLPPLNTSGYTGSQTAPNTSRQRAPGSHQSLASSPTNIPTITAASRPHGKPKQSPRNRQAGANKQKKQKHHVLHRGSDPLDNPNSYMVNDDEASPSQPEDEQPAGSEEDAPTAADPSQSQEQDLSNQQEEQYDANQEFSNHHGSVSYYDANAYSQQYFSDYNDSIQPYDEDAYLAYATGSASGDSSYPAASTVGANTDGNNAAPPAAAPIDNNHAYEADEFPQEPDLAHDPL